MSRHLSPDSGYLSIDVINLLGSAILGLHIEEAHTAWDALRQCQGASALVNWNQAHWTVLEAWPRQSPVRWRHTNSITCGSLTPLCYGRQECEAADVEAILTAITNQRGSATLHRITVTTNRGEEYLEPASRRAMLGPEDMAVDEEAGEIAGAQAAEVVRLVTMNVAGVGDALGPAATRMDDILTKLLADENPNVLCFQEVTDEMYRERKARSLIFDTRPLCDPEPWPMVLPHPRRPRAGSLALPSPTLPSLSCPTTNIVS